MEPKNGMSSREKIHGVPLDYSFCDLTHVQDCLDETPRSGQRIKKDESSAADAPEQQDGESKETLLASLMDGGPVTKQRTAIANPNKVTTILKLNNNSLTEVTGLAEVLPKLLAQPNLLHMVDLSFNGIKRISDDLLELPNLQILYLHGNEIKSLSSVSSLAKCPMLRGLTLHGNDVEEIEGYRQYVITNLPRITSLDFTRIIPKERSDALHVVARAGFNSKK